MRQWTSIREEEVYEGCAREEEEEEVYEGCAREEEEEVYEGCARKVRGKENKSRRIKKTKRKRTRKSSHRSSDLHNPMKLTSTGPFRFIINWKAVEILTLSRRVPRKIRLLRYLPLTGSPIMT